MYKLRCDPFIGIFLNTSRMSSKCNLWYKICRNSHFMLYMMIKHILFDTDRYILGYSNVIYACYFTCLVAKLKYLWMHIRIFAKAFPSNYISCHDVIWIIRDLIFEINSEIIKESLFRSEYFKSCYEYLSLDSNNMYLKIICICSNNNHLWRNILRWN